MERLSRQQFEWEIRGDEFRHQQREDIAAMIGLYIIAAQGGKKQDGSPYALADLLGREPARLWPAPALTEAQREAQEWAEMEAQAKRDRALLEVYKMQVLQAQREGRGPEVVGG